MGAARRSAWPTRLTHVVWINDTEYVYDPSEVSAINIYAGDGADSIAIVGGAEDETAELWVGSVRVVGTTYEVYAQSVEQIDFRYVLSYSRFGSDTATLYDETADVTSYGARFVANADWAKLFCGAFYSRTEGFTVVRAATSGGDDLAWLYDDPERVDRLVVPSTIASLTPCKAELRNDHRTIYVDDFHTLTASTSQDFVDDQDVEAAYVDDVILEGRWADAPSWDQLPGSLDVSVGVASSASVAGWPRGISLPRAVSPPSAPSPIVSTAVEGTMIIDPFWRRPS